MRPDHWSIQKPSNLLAYLAGIAVIAMMMHVVADVLSREILSQPLDGTVEIVSFYYMVAVTFLPLAYVSHHEGHIMVELFTRGLKPRAMSILELVVLLVSLAFTVWMFTAAWDAALESYEDNEMWETSDDLIIIWPSRFLYPLGVLLMGIYLIYRVVDEARNAFGARLTESAND